MYICVSIVLSYPFNSFSSIRNTATRQLLILGITLIYCFVDFSDIIIGGARESLIENAIWKSIIKNLSETWDIVQSTRQAQLTNKPQKLWKEKIESPHTNRNLRLNSLYDHKKQESNTRKDDELVKNVRNSPAYLQREEKREKRQGKGFNFGVLDWGRLENRKSNEKRIPPKVNMKASPSTSRPPILKSGTQGVHISKGKLVQPHDSVVVPRNCSNINLDRVKRKYTDKITTSGMEASSSDSKSFNLSNSRTSFDELRFSDCFFPEANIDEEPFSKILHSCPLPFGAETPEHMSVSDSSSLSESSVRFYHDLDEEPNAKSTHHTPSRLFSFSFGKMARSLSFKEGLSVPQLSSTHTSVKSSPLKSETSTSFEHLNSGKSRASPLRRFLDPLLKPKVGRSTKAVQPGRRSEDLLQIKKRGSSSVQANLQLTIKNEIPFFKLVVDDSSDILVAAVKKLSCSGKKGDSSLIYLFYSVKEIKKKSGGWLNLNQGSKEKSVDFDYNIVGQLKVFSSFEDKYVIREFVLCSVDPGQSDKRTPEFESNRELAGIVVKDPSEEDSCRDGQFGKNTVVVLPGGVHSVPIHGMPYPLITRWRSGQCDCGGWDVGCKLQILTDRETCEITKMSFPGSSTDCVDLFCQNGKEGNKKSFSLAMVKNGLYSLEYDASLSLLQAFSICVAFITTQKLAHLCEVPEVSENHD